MTILIVAAITSLGVGAVNLWPPSDRTREPAPSPADQRMATLVGI